jgi:hypothetical protein
MHGAGRFGLTSLANLDQVIVGGPGCPLRVIAITPEHRTQGVSSGVLWSYPSARRYPLRLEQPGHPNPAGARGSCILLSLATTD